MQWIAPSEKDTANGTLETRLWAAADQLRANSGLTSPGINQQTVGGLELILPDEKTAAHFDRLVEPLLAEIINLAKRIQNLRRTRDLLLPRLLSGQIENLLCPTD